MTESAQARGDLRVADVVGYGRLAGVFSLAGVGCREKKCRGR